MPRLRLSPLCFRFQRRRLDMLLDQLTRQFPHRQLPLGQPVESELAPAAASEPALSIKSEPAGLKRDKPGDPPGTGAGAGAGPNKKIKVER